MSSIFDIEDVVSDKIFYVFPANSKFSSPATKIFALTDENRTVCARLKRVAFITNVGPEVRHSLQRALLIWGNTVCGSARTLRTGIAEFSGNSSGNEM